MMSVAIVLMWCGVALMDSYRYDGAEPGALTSARASTAVLVGLFAGAHACLLAKNRMSFSVGVLFYPLVALLVLTSAVVVRAVGKVWAPATPSDALYSSVGGIALLGVVCAACIANVYWPWPKECADA